MDQPTINQKENEIVKETIVEQKIRQFRQLSDFLEHWYYKPDMDALKICLSAYAAHEYDKDDPVWLFIIGAPGTGKTSVAIRAINFLPNTTMVANLTPNSFLSGFGENNGILGRLTRKSNGDGVLLFPDFTSLLAKKEDIRNDIVGQMRHIYDGEFTKEVGNKGESITWKGKVTCLAAVTPALEDYWAINRSLGERFMYLRWNGGRGKLSATFAHKQVGNEVEIQKEFQKKILEYVDLPLRGVKIPADADFGMDGLAEMVSRLRTVVRRELNKGKRTVSGIDETEAPTRISKMLTMIARGSATLDRRAEIDFFDIELAKRVAMDSVPKNRGRIIQVLLDTLNYEASLGQILVQSKLHKSCLQRTISDLIAIEVVSLVEVGNRKYLILDPEIIDCWEDSITAIARDVEPG